MDYEELYEIIEVASGKKPAEFVLRNAEIINVFNGAYETADIAIHRGRIAGIGSYRGDYERELQRSIVVPGFIDGHMHIETSMLRPEILAETILQHGTTTVVVDPHEIANVAGISGVNYLLKAARDAPIDFFFMAPSSVPSTLPDIETTGASISAGEIAMLFSDPAFLGLAEVMDITGIMAGNRATLEKLLIAAGHPIDGHAPELKGRTLNAYLVAGATSDHETAELAEGIEKIGRGMFLMVREGSVAKNLSALLPSINYMTSRHMAIVTDDRSLVDIMEEGHIDYIIRQAISQGVDIRLALQMATLNPAQHFGLADRGAIVPGRIADLVVLEDMTEVAIRTVVKNGVIVFDVGHDFQFIEAVEPPITLRNSIFAGKVAAADFQIAAAGRHARVIKVIPDEILTGEQIITPPTENGFVVSDPQSDVLKIAVINRYSRELKMATGLIKGLGLRSGAMASSVAHDAHNLLVAGASDEDLALAINTVIDMQGGQVVVDQGSVLAELPLRIGGLIAEETSEHVYATMKELTEAAKALGSALSDPFMTLSFMSLATVPKLKITDKGLVDVDAGRIVGLFSG